MDFYERVKLHVKNNTSLTLRAFIESLGINYDSYNGLKRYKNQPRLDEAIKIADALGVPVEFLYSGKERDDITDEEIALIIRFRNLSPTNKKLTKELIAALDDKK